ncbi:hypothetical protein [Saccharolobus sp.]|uniref:hypothetical protein n=1 Tax=Saccharolobus sp. TaxID=2100761 RepID=UPI003181CE45
MVSEISSLASSLPSSFSSLASDAQSLVSSYNQLSKEANNAYTFYSGVNQIQQYLNQQDYQDAYDATTNLAKSLGISVEVGSITQQSYQPPSTDPETETLYYLRLLSKWGIAYNSIVSQYQQQISSLSSQQSFSSYAQIFNALSQMYNQLQQITPAANAAFSYFGQQTFPPNYFSLASQLMRNASSIASRIANDLAQGNYNDIVNINLNFSELSQLPNNSLTQSITSSIQQNLADFATAVANLQYNISFTNSVNNALQQVSKAGQSYTELAQAYSQAAQQIQNAAHQRSASVQVPGVGVVNVQLSNDVVNSATETSQKLQLISQAYSSLAQATQNSNNPKAALQDYQAALNDFQQAGADQSALNELRGIVSFYQYLANNEGTLQSIQNQLKQIGNVSLQVSNGAVKLGSVSIVASAATTPVPQMVSSIKSSTGLSAIQQQIDSFYSGFPPLPQNIQQQVNNMKSVADTTVDLYANNLAAQAYIGITQLPNVTASQQISALQNAQQALQNTLQDAQTLQSLGVNVDTSHIQQSIGNINKSVSEIQSLQSQSQQLQNVMKQIQGQLQTPQTAESLTSNLMNLANQGLQIVDNIISTYQKYGQTPDQSILSLQKKLQDIYNNAKNEHDALIGQQARQSFSQSGQELAQGNILGAIVSGITGVAQSLQTAGENVIANFTSIVGTAINDGLNDLSNFITHAIPGLAGQIIAGLVIGGLFAIIQFIPGVDAAVDIAAGAAILSATLGSAIQQYYLSGVSNPVTIVKDIGESFITPEGLATLIAGIGLSFAAPRIVDDVSGLFKSTDDVKISGINLENAKVDLEDVKAKISDALSNLKLNKDNIDVKALSSDLGNLNDVLNVKGVLKNISDYIDNLSEQLKGIVKINAEVRLTEEGVDVKTADFPLSKGQLTSMNAIINKITQGEVELEPPQSKIVLGEQGTLVKNGNTSVILKNEGELSANLKGNSFIKVSKGATPETTFVTISSGKLQGYEVNSDLVTGKQPNIATTDFQGLVNRLSSVAEDVSQLESTFESGNKISIPIGKDLAIYIQSKLNALASRIMQSKSTIADIASEKGTEAALEEANQLGISQEIESAFKELSEIRDRFNELKTVGNALQTAKNLGIDVDPLLKDFIDGKIDIDALQNALNDKFNQYFSTKFNSLENDILNLLQEKGVSSDKIEEAKNGIDKLINKELGSSNSPDGYHNAVDLLNTLNELKTNLSRTTNPTDAIDVVDQVTKPNQESQFNIKITNLSRSNTEPTTTKPGESTPGQVNQSASGQSTTLTTQSETTNTLNLPLKYSLSDIINNARQTFGSVFDQKLYALSKLFGTDSLNQLILDAAKESPNPDLSTISSTLNDLIGSKLDDAIKSSPESVISTIEDELQVTNGLVKSKLTTDLLTYLKNNPNVKFSDLLSFAENDLPSVINDVKSTLTNSVLDQLTKGLGDLSNLIGKDSLQTFVEDEIQKGVLDANTLLDDAKAFVDSKLTELLQTNPEQVLSTILGNANIGNKVIQDKLVTDALNFIKSSGGNVTLQDVINYIVKDASDLETQLANDLKTGNVNELSSQFPDLQTVFAELKTDPVKGLKDYFSMVDPTIAEGLSKITSNNALDVISALNNNDLAKVAQMTGLSVDQLQSPEVKLSLISVTLDDLLNKFKAKLISDTEFESALEGLKQILDEISPGDNGFLQGSIDNLKAEVQTVEEFVKQNKLPSAIEQFDNLITGISALPIYLSIVNNDKVKYLLNYSNQLSTEEQTPQVNGVPQQEVQTQSTTVLPTPPEPGSLVNSEPLAPPNPTNAPQPPEYPIPLGPNAPALPGGTSRSVSGRTQKEIIYFPL